MPKSNQICRLLQESVIQNVCFSEWSSQFRVDSGIVLSFCSMCFVKSSSTRVFFCLTQASELASFIHAHSDLGCRAPTVVHLEEGLNCDSSLSADFWNLLGGRTQYRGQRATVFTDLKLLYWCFCGWFSIISGWQCYEMNWKKDGSCTLPSVFTPDIQKVKLNPRIYFVFTLHRLFWLLINYKSTFFFTFFSSLL